MPEQQLPLSDEPVPPSDGGIRNRLRLAGSRAPSEHVDGAWWPRSNRLVDELPSLLHAVHDRLASVALVGYTRNGWTEAPADMTADGRSIELLGSNSQEPPSVILIGEDGHHLTLRVIAPATDEQQARHALDAVPQRAASMDARSTAAGRSVAEVAKRLAEHEGRNDRTRDAEILAWCEEAALQLEDARIQTFVPILVEHIVNNRIHQEHHAAASAQKANRAVADAD